MLLERKRSVGVEEFEMVAGVDERTELLILAALFVAEFLFIKTGVILQLFPAVTEETFESPGTSVSVFLYFLFDIPKGTLL